MTKQMQREQWQNYFHTFFHSTKTGIVQQNWHTPVFRKEAAYNVRNLYSTFT